MKDLDYKIVNILLRHYFCNVCEFAVDELSTLNYYQKLIDKVNADCDIDWNDLEDFVIWEPFENTSPSYIVDNMMDLYKEISFLIEEKTSISVKDNN